SLGEGEATDAARPDNSAFEASLDEAALFILRARATGALLGSDSEREAAQGLVDYWTTVLSRAGREVEDITVEEYDPGLAPELPEELYPYPGINSVGSARNDGLFGRKRLIEAGLARLKAGRLLAVVGPARGGKSSLVRGGLLPALQAGALPGSRQWRYPALITPGSEPLNALARLVPEAATEAEEGFARSPGRLARLLAESGGEPAVIVVDRFEEVFLLCQDDAARRMFVENLLGVVRSPAPRHLVILSLRQGFADRVAQMPSLQPIFAKAQLAVTPPNAAELREAIQIPADRIGLKFGDGVVDALIQDLLGESEAFALLQFSLRELWDRRERNRITMDAFRKVGGGRVAIVRAAEGLFTQLDEADQGECKRILLNLSRPEAASPGGNGMAGISGRRIPRRSLARPDGREVTDRVLGRLVQAFLIRRIRGAQPDDEQIEMVHDALVRNWPRMIDWLADNRMAMVALRRLDDRAAEWIVLNRTGGLFDEFELREAERWLASTEAAELGVHGAVHDLVQASREAIAADEASQEAARLRELQQLRDLAEEQTRRARAEAGKARLERKRARLRVYSLSVGLLLMGIVLSLFWINNNLLLSNNALKAKQAQIVKSQKLAFQSLALNNERLDLALLLALEADQQDKNNLDARSSILAGLQQSPRLLQYLWRPDELKAFEKRPMSPATSVAISPDGRVMASGYEDGAIQLWVAPDPAKARDGARFKKTTLLDPPPSVRERVHCLAFSGDGRYLAAGKTKGVIRLWELRKDGSIIKDLGKLPIEHNEEKTVNGLAFQPKSSMALASAGEDGAVVLWDINRRTKIQEHPGAHPGGALSVSFRPDGKVLASGGRDGIIILWDHDQDRILERRGEPLKGHSEAVSSVVFSPDGKTLASGGMDNTVVLWGLDRDRAYPIGQPLKGHADDVTSLAFNPDGGSLASAGADEVVVL
ncbi:MAG: hypothetical protein ABI353_19165, partial [Isosphaeraceae bacterium]